MILFTKQFTFYICMFVESLDIYRLIIPIFMMVLGYSIIALKRLFTLPNYLAMHAWATSIAGLSLLLYSIIDPRLLTFAPPFTSGLLFITCALFCYAIHLRFDVKMNWPFVALSIITAEILIIFYTIFGDSYNIRLIILGIVPCLIFGHNLFKFTQLKLTNPFDQVLRFFVILLILVVLLRVGYLVIFGSAFVMLDNDYLFATLHLIILYLSIAFTLLLICCAFQDVFLQLRQERNHDPLTGLSNRRALMERIETLQSQPISPNAILICDLDHFKKINDVYGHQVGDLALQHVSQIMRTHIRTHTDHVYPDEIARIGGEEFMIILQDVSQTEAIRIAERIRQSVEASPLVYKGITIPLTMSIGLSFFHFYSEFEHAIEQADQKMYEAKRDGRNQVVSMQHDIA